jgi:hypothetical protein
MNNGHGQKRSRKREQAIAALLSEPTVQAAAPKAGVSLSTLKRWLKEPGFRAAYRRARRELVEGAVGRMQAATGEAVTTLLTVARSGARDGDRVRAAVAILDNAQRGLVDADALHGAAAGGDGPPMGTGDVVQLLGSRLRQIEQSELSTGEKSRLTAALADALLRAIAVDVVDRRLEALQAVLRERKEKP